MFKNPSKNIAASIYFILVLNEEFQYKNELSLVLVSLIDIFINNFEYILCMDMHAYKYVLKSITIF